MPKGNKNNLISEQLPPEKTDLPQKDENFFSRFPWAIVVIASVAAVAILGVSFLLVQNRQLKSTLNKKEQALPPAEIKNDLATQQREDLLKEVGKLLVLPNNEQPTIATVTDLEKLKDQPFFAKAQVGDKLLIYAASGKAILFRPGENKIIEIAPINVDSQNQPKSSPQK